MSARHMTSGRVVEAHRTFQDHTLDALRSSMALQYDGSNVGVVLLLNVFTQFLFLPTAENRLNPSYLPRSLDG